MLTPSRGWGRPGIPGDGGGTSAFLACDTWRGSPGTVTDTLVAQGDSSERTGDALVAEVGLDGGSDAHGVWAEAEGRVPGVSDVLILSETLQQGPFGTMGDVGGREVTWGD